MAQIMSEYQNFNFVEMERLKKMLSEKEVAIIKQAKEVEQWVWKQADTEERLRVANKLLLQREREIEVEREKMKAEMAQLKSMYEAEVIELEDANYASFEEGFN